MYKITGTNLQGSIKIEQTFENNECHKVKEKEKELLDQKLIVIIDNINLTRDEYADSLLVEYANQLKTGSLGN